VSGAASGAAAPELAAKERFKAGLGDVKKLFGSSGI
jgi:hypothetical protein